MSQERSAGYLSYSDGGFGTVPRAGIVLALVGAALISLSTANVLASAAFVSERNQVLHGSNNADVPSGGPGDDEVYGGPGKDILLGGRGSDFTEAKDGEADYVACGAGDDVASTDEEDYVANDCEVVYSG